MTIRHIFIAIFSGLVMVFSLVASADAYVIEFPSYYGLDLKFSGTVTESYSNNITFANNNEEKQEDFQTNLVLGFDMKYAGKKRSGAVSGRMNRQMFLKEDETAIPSENLSVNFQSDLTRYDRLSIGNVFSHTQIPYSFAEEFGRYRGKLDQQHNSFQISYTKDISKELSLSTGYVNSVTWTGNQSLPDTTQNTLNLNFNYNQSELTRYSLLYSYMDSKSGNSAGATNQNTSVGISRNLTKSLSINLNVGFNASTINDKKYTTENYSVSFSFGDEFLLDRRTITSITYARSVQVLQDRNDIFDNWRVALNVKRDILKDFVGDISFFYGQGEYLSSGDKDELLGASIKFNYNMWEGKKGQSVDSRLGYTYSQLNSNVENRDYTRGTADFGLVAMF